MPKALIIGGGVAGCVLALSLKERGWQVHMADYNFSLSASKVAAGIVNPITGKRFSLTWEAANSWKYLSQFYPFWEEKLGQRFFYPMPLLRFLHNQEQLNDWSGRADDERFTPFLADPMIQDHPHFPKHHFGFLVLKQTGWLNTKTFIATVQQWLHSQHAFTQEKVEGSELLQQTVPKFNDVTYDVCIQCAGLRPFDDPVWHWLPFTPMRGEVLDIYSKSFPQDSIFVKQHFILPTGHHRFKVGSTYDWRITEEVVTEEGKNSLMSFAREIMHGDFELKGASAGIRPAVKDRRPLIGRHPDNPAFFLFNGFGSKAVSLAPWLAACLADHIETDQPLPQAADLKRFC